MGGAASLVSMGRVPIHKKKASFRQWEVRIFLIVALSFVFDKYYSIIG
jgi:hypothetical protein